jgi:hypothetical protein
MVTKMKVKLLYIIDYFLVRIIKRGGRRRNGAHFLQWRVLFKKCRIILLGHYSTTALTRVVDR